MLTIIISKDFSDTVGGRYRAEGDYSGEQFREELLEPKVKEAISNNEKLLIDFDGGYGYPTSFLEESFGGLIRIGFELSVILNLLIFKSEDNPKIIDRVKNYISEAKKDEK